MQISPGETVVTASHLIDLLGECLIESHPGNQVSLGERANYEQNIQDAMAIFPNLQTGLDVNVKFHRYVCGQNTIIILITFVCIVCLSIHTIVVHLYVGGHQKPFDPS